MKMGKDMVLSGDQIEPSCIFNNFEGDPPANITKNLKIFCLHVLMQMHTNRLKNFLFLIP